MVWLVRQTTSARSEMKDSICITPVTDREDVLYADKLFLPKPEDTQQFKHEEIAEAQNEKPVITRVYWYVHLTFEEQQQKPLQLKTFFVIDTSFILIVRPIFRMLENGWCYQVGTELSHSENLTNRWVILVVNIFLTLHGNDSTGQE